MRFHVLTVPHCATSLAYVGCAFTQKALKFCTMMKARGHTIIHYGNQDSDVECDEHVTVTTRADFEREYSGYDWFTQGFNENICQRLTAVYDTNCPPLLEKRIEHKDFILAFWGCGNMGTINRIANDARHKAMVVEPGIGNHHAFSNFRVFESYANMAYVAGMNNKHNPNNYHVVIPNYFDPRMFESADVRGDYFLFLGRLSSCKGLHIAIDICKQLGIPLKVAGQGSWADVGYPHGPPEGVEYLGYADVQTRKKLMSKAKGFFLLSDYNEPFGGSAVEAMMSGCPVITTDWGAFPEIVMHGYTGYRVRTMAQALWAAKHVNQIDPRVCRKWAVDNYGMDRVAGMYEEYFSSLMDLWDDGWYQSHPERGPLDWLKQTWPTIEWQSDGPAS